MTDSGPKLHTYQLMPRPLLEDMRWKLGLRAVLSTVCLKGPFSRHHEGSSTHDAHLTKGIRASWISFTSFTTTLLYL